MPPEGKHHSERTRPTEDPFDSLSTNRLCLFIKGKQVWIEPAHANKRAPVAGHAVPGNLPLTYLSVWNPYGDRHSLAENRALHEQLRSRIDVLGLSAIEAVTVAANGSWFEQGLAITGLTTEQADALVREFHQVGYIRLDGDGWHSTPRDTTRAPRHQSFSVITRTKRRCPVRMFDASAELCHMQGGHFTSRSRTYAAIWEIHRGVGLELLGCSVCKNGTESVFAYDGKTLLPPRRSTITLREASLASRYGGYCWGRLHSDEELGIADEDHDDEQDEMEDQESGEIR